MRQFLALRRLPVKCPATDGTIQCLTGMAVLHYLMSCPYAAPWPCRQLSLPGFNPTTFLSSESEQLTWQREGLASDTLSAQNALAVLHGLQTPLVIDPSSQVNDCLDTSKTGCSAVESCSAP
eukprot:GHRR01033615.1.p1 GENE.GHRR01033615.1~~GHRR01033615.1.p1  ORF type:complete len:122 (+),score=16.53 GHRR01033615.1:720-1085(+)